MATNLTSDDIRQGNQLPNGRDTRNDDVCIFYNTITGNLSQTPMTGSYQIQEWVAKIYEKDPQVIIIDNKIYRLNTYDDTFGGQVTVPFTSTDFATEFANDNWRTIGSNLPAPISGDEGKKVIVSDSLDYELAPSTTSSGFYDPDDITITFDGTDLFLTPGSGSFKFVTNSGDEYEKTTNDSITITLTDLSTYIYYDNNGQLQQLHNQNRDQQEELLNTTLPVAFIIYNGNAAQVVLIGRYLKGRVSTGLWVKNFFDKRVYTLTGLLVSGLTGGSGTVDADAQLALSEGRLLFTDQKLSVPNRTTTDVWNIGYFDSNIKPVGVIGNAFLILTDIDLGIGVSGLAVYNNDGVPAAASSGNYIWYFIIQTVDITPSDRILSYMGNNQYGNLSLAEDSLSSEVAIIESRLIAKQGLSLKYAVLIETKSTFANTPKSRIEEVIEIRDIASGSPTVSVPDDLINGSDASLLHNHNSLYVTIISAFFKNIANTLTAFFNLENLTSNRTITWQDKDITVSGLLDTSLINATFDIGTSDDNPGAGNFRYNNATQSAATQLNINEETGFNAAVTIEMIDSLKTGSTIKAECLTNQNKWAVLKLSNNAINSSTFTKLPLTVVSKGTDFAAGDQVSFVLLNAGGGTSERGNNTIVIASDLLTTTVDFDSVEVRTLDIDDGITDHTIAVSNLSTTERYNTLIIDNTDNLSGLTVVFNDQTGAIQFRGSKNDFPGIYPNMNVSSGAIWNVSFENRSATLTEVSFDELEVY